MNVAILGRGFVGRATQYFLQEYCPKVAHIYVEDPGLGMYVDDYDWNSVTYTFICVPTNEVNGKLDLSILFQALKRARGIPVIRSTLGPDQMALIGMAHNGPFLHWPEFLREKHWQKDVDDKSIPIVVGGPEEWTESFVNHVLPSDREIFEGNLQEAALMKISRNAMLATKVAQANMLYDQCSKWKASYKLIRKFMITDGSLGTTHWDVPGPDNGRGFGGKCFPKDTKHYESLFDEDNIYTMALDYNDTIYP